MAVRKDRVPEKNEIAQKPHFVFLGNTRSGFPCATLFPVKENHGNLRAGKQKQDAGPNRVARASRLLVSVTNIRQTNFNNMSLKSTSLAPIRLPEINLYYYYPAKSPQPAQFFPSHPHPHPRSFRISRPLSVRPSPAKSGLSRTADVRRQGLGNPSPLFALRSPLFHPPPPTELLAINHRLVYPSLMRHVRFYRRWCPVVFHWRSYGKNSDHR